MEMSLLLLLGVEIDGLHAYIVLGFAYQNTSIFVETCSIFFFHNDVKLRYGYYKYIYMGYSKERNASYCTTHLAPNHE
ncbi:hypothetical protein BO85DRAFT_221211 [Aspergillus piperis CBS 112811]|uniref:Uncharacterized protein n=1 Tax=Aspergillus piperis CBS 112811 TaxID=1448313 RepID=A0A8G1VNW7_9EURO|nr:hypothetical protein BO85DRAFT_221211 [Aspergillus piperis CBS 112811]RAH60186.1 hypothetical protein BO85DRAFT_221211 [Aspergillus piperis CBS 112811]